MKKYLTLFLSLVLSLVDSYGQNLGEYYIAISMDSTQGGRLKFLSDTTVELSSIPRHMFPSIKKVYKYTTTDTTVVILPNTIITKPNDKPAGLYVQDFALKSKLSLSKIDRGFIDFKKSHIYVLLSCPKIG